MESPIERVPEPGDDDFPEYYDEWEPEEEEEDEEVDELDFEDESWDDFRADPFFDDFQLDD